MLPTILDRESKRRSKRLVGLLRKLPQRKPENVSELYRGLNNHVTHLSSNILTICEMYRLDHFHILLNGIFLDQSRLRNIVSACQPRGYGTLTLMTVIDEFSANQSLIICSATLASNLQTSGSLSFFSTTSFNLSKRP